MQDVPRFSKPGLLAGGLALTGVAGFVNVVMLRFFHVPVSHMSGAASHLSEDLLAGQVDAVAYTATVLLAFLGGATVCGVVIGKTSLRLGRRYGVTLMLEGAFLMLAAWLARGGSAVALPTAAFACGLQNAMATNYHHTVIRTTHVTGTVTDLGLMIGHALKGEGVHKFSAAMLVTLLAGFIGGGAVGVALFNLLGLDALWVPAVGTFIAGAVYAAWRWSHGVAA